MDELMETLERQISIHAPSCEGATLSRGLAGLPPAISIHAPSCEGATVHPHGTASADYISIHAPSCEGATSLVSVLLSLSAYFNPRPLV